MKELGWGRRLQNMGLAGGLCREVCRRLPFHLCSLAKVWETEDTKMAWGCLEFNEETVEIGSDTRAPAVCVTLE